MSTRYPHLRAALARRPWAMSADWLAALVEVIGARLEGTRLSPEQAAEVAGTHSTIERSATIAGVRLLNGMSVPVAFTASGDPHVLDVVAASRSSDSGGPAPGSLVAVIGVMGIVAQHASQVDDISGPGGTSTERVSMSLRAALADPAVKAIVLNIDSPGGNVYGVAELADQIFQARDSKPIVAQVNSLAASAAYWIASAAAEIVVTPSGEVGSIGVYALHKDVSEAAEMDGIKFTFVSAGKYKVEGNPFEPLGEEAAAALQASVDGYYVDFLKGVARGRGVTVAAVRAGFGEGRVVRAADALAQGMADRIGTLDETLRRLMRGKPSPGPKAGALASGAELAVAEETISPPPAPHSSADVEEQRRSAEARDAFRRRRHAARRRAA